MRARRARVLVPAIVALMVVGLAGPVAANPRVCADPVVVEAFNDLAYGGGSEGVAVARNGDVFLGTSWEGKILRAPKGDFDNVTVLTDDLPTMADDGAEMAGIEVDRHGNVYAAVISPEEGVNGVWRVQPDGTAELAGSLPAGYDIANDIAIDNRDNVYASDTYGWAIWKLDPDGGPPTVWLQGEELPWINGLTYHGGALYAGLILDGRIVRIPIKPDGAPGVPEVVVEDPSLMGMDGIEVDPVGNIYVANNWAWTIQRITAKTGEIETIVENNGGAPLSSPASMAISRNHRSIYAANLNESGFFPGPAENPLLVRVDFPVPVQAWDLDCG
jgi:streptogramin lyase